MEVPNTIKAKSKRKSLNVFMSLPYYIILFSLILIPILMMVLFSFQKGTSRNIFTVSFTLENYTSFFVNPDYSKAMWRSIWLAFLTTSTTLLIGYPLAYFISRTKRKTQGLLILLITAPMWINLVIRTIALSQIIDITIPGINGTTTAMVIGFTHVYLPFMVLPIYTVLSKIDPALNEASTDLGANSFKTFLKVTLPLSIPGVMSGILMVFLPAATTLVIPKYLGNNVYLIGNLIERIAIESGAIGYGSAMAIILSIIMMIMIVIIRRVNRYKEVEIDD